MRLAAADAFHSVSEPLEGRVGWMYLDVKGLVTTGLGNLLSTPEDAVRLPFVRHNGSLASAEEKRAAWHVVHDAQHLKSIGGGMPHWQRLTSLRLPDAALDDLVESKLAGHELHLMRAFQAWHDWPADAHLALHLWAWAVGPASPYPRMFAALRAGQFDEAARESTITPQAGTVVERNRIIRTCLRNAHRVRMDLLDPGTLYYPRDLEDETATLPDGDLGRVLRMTGTREAVQEALKKRDEEPDPAA